MKLLPVTAASLTLLFAIVGHAEEPLQRSFKWTDDKGVVHYGDRVPAEFSRRQTTELNRQGVAVNQSPAQLSPNDAQSAEERSAAAARQKQHDGFLLTTYTSTRDIEQLRDERIGLVEAQILASDGFLTAAKTRMKTLQERAKGYRPYSTSANARRMPDPLAEDIVRTLNEERAQKATMERKQREKDQLRATFQADIDRYQALLASRSAASR
jgi:uncharacterized protein DUF4124